MNSNSWWATLAVAWLACACAATQPARTYALEPVSIASATALERIAVAAPSQQTALGTTRIYFGQESLDSDFWDPIDKQFDFGVETAFESFNDWAGGEWGFLYSDKKDETSIVDPVAGPADYKVESLKFEGYFGIHRTFLRGSNFMPYVGAGLSLFYYDAQKNTDAPGLHRHDDDEGGFAYGAYAHGGLAVQVSENVQLGLDLRMVGFTDVNDLGGDGDIDYQRVAFFIGFGG